MRHVLRLLSAVIVSVALVAASAALFAAPAQAKTWLAPAADIGVDPLTHLNEFENRMLIQINKARAKAGLKKVRLFESCVDDTSERWALRIKRTGEFEHRDQMSVINRCDLAWTGETLVRGTGLTPESAVNAWLNSPSHYDVIMKKRARWAGIGVRIDSDLRVVGVLNFGDAT
ncbi:MAG: CAP domain-containing protein [Nocardioides sp.]